MEIALVGAITTVLELAVVFLLNKKEENMKLPWKYMCILFSAVNALLAVYAWYCESQGGLRAVWYFGLWTYLFVLTVYDIRYRELPDWWHMLPILFLISAWIFGYQPVVWKESVFVALVLAAILGLTYLLRKDAIGLGDIKLILICGLYCGSFCVGVLTKGLTLAFVCGLLLLLFRKATAKSELPFVPFLFVGSLFI